jgi:uncharacterized RDD family membrane protein YckC
MATFGKKTTGSAQASAFGRRPAATSSAGVFAKPAHPSGDLSPEARAFLEAERGMRASEPSSAFPMPSNASPSFGGAVGKPAGKPVFGRRIIARIVDELLIIIPMGLILMPSLSSAVGALATAEPGSFEATNANLALLKTGLLVFLAQAIYGIAMESSAAQATLGKLMVGAIVTNRDGGKPGIGSVIMRNTLGRAAVNIIPFYAGYLLGLFRTDRKGVHDLMAGTMVCARGAGRASYSEVFA